MEKAIAALLVVAGVVVVLAGFQMYRVHEESWQWRLQPSAAPPKVGYDGRDYERGAQEDPPEGLMLRTYGQTAGGADILDTDEPGTTTLIWIRDGDTTWVYGLMGGP